MLFADHIQGPHFDRFSRMNRCEQEQEWMPIHYAAFYGHVETLRWLLQEDAVAQIQAVEKVNFNNL